MEKLKRKKKCKYRNDKVAGVLFPRCFFPFKGRKIKKNVDDWEWKRKYQIKRHVSHLIGICARSSSITLQRLNDEIEKKNLHNKKLAVLMKRFFRWLASTAPRVSSMKKKTIFIHKKHFFFSFSLLFQNESDQCQGNITSHGCEKCLLKIYNTFGFAKRNLKCKHCCFFLLFWKAFVPSCCFSSDVISKPLFPFPNNEKINFLFVMKLGGKMLWTSRRQQLCK